MSGTDLATRGECSTTLGVGTLVVGRVARCRNGDLLSVGHKQTNSLLDIFITLLHVNKAIKLSGWWDRCHRIMVSEETLGPGWARWSWTGCIAVCISVYVLAITYTNRWCTETSFIGMIFHCIYGFWGLCPQTSTAALPQTPALPLHPLHYILDKSLQIGVFSTILVCIASTTDRCGLDVACFVCMSLSIRMSVCSSRPWALQEGWTNPNAMSHVGQRLGSRMGARSSLLNGVNIVAIWRVWLNMFSSVMWAGATVTVASCSDFLKMIFFY